MGIEAIMLPPVTPLPPQEHDTHVHAAHQASRHSHTICGGTGASAPPSREQSSDRFGWLRCGKPSNIGSARSTHHRVLAVNRRAIQRYKARGTQHEGTLRDAVFDRIRNWLLAALAREHRARRTT